MNEDQLKEWIRNNLILEAEFVDRLGPCMDVRVQLRFEGEFKPFVSDVITIP